LPNEASETLALQSIRDFDFDSYTSTALHPKGGGGEREEEEEESSAS
jgi:hypothetical protein